MTAAARNEPAEPIGCWCCGATLPEEELVRLGEHPEVGVCLACAVWVKRRAAARRRQLRSSLSGRLLDRLAGVRNAVIGRGWHERGLLGALLRRIDRYLP